MKDFYNASRTKYFSNIFEIGSPYGHQRKFWLLLDSGYSASLAYKCNYLSDLVTNSRFKAPLIIDFGISNYMANLYHNHVSVMINLK